MFAALLLSFAAKQSKHVDAAPRPYFPSIGASRRGLWPGGSPSSCSGSGVRTCQVWTMTGGCFSAWRAPTKLLRGRTPPWPSLARGGTLFGASCNMAAFYPLTQRTRGTSSGCQVGSIGNRNCPIDDGDPNPQLQTRCTWYGPEFPHWSMGPRTEGQC